MKYQEGEAVWVNYSAGYPREGTVALISESDTSPYPYGVQWVNSAGMLRTTFFGESELSPRSSDPINSPSHYTGFSKGLEVIDLTEGMNFCRGNVIKYIMRAGRKSTATEVEDLKKAAWYVRREIERLEKENKSA